jgi:transglutaminase-like putative cysteine protease
MRIAISHTIAYRYAKPAKGVIQTLRLTPRNHAAQHVARWRAEIDADARLRQSEDAFGNIVHTLDAVGPIEAFSIRVEGEVETRDTAGVLSGAVERFPTELYLRSSDLTALTPDMAEYAGRVRQSCGSNGSDRLTVLHSLMSTLHGDLTLDPAAGDGAAKAADAYAAKRGVYRDHAHVFCAMARHLDIPASYVSGYFRRADDSADPGTSHAWAEAHVPGLGWVGFDAVHDVCATERHVRVAVGLDYLGAAPVRGSRLGGADESRDVRIGVTQVQMQS